MKNNKGFSLVELIVVIAIMAVLAAVAVIGVSVYIPKAQQAADQQMVADIQKAIDLYAQLEGAELQPGQSGYVVIKKTDSNGGGAISFVVMPVGAEEENPGDGSVTNGNVTVGDNIADGQFVRNALISYFGENYDKELKVSYGGWTNIMTEQEVDAIKNSGFINNVYGKEDGILETVDMLTDAMKLYYGDAANAQEQANQTVLNVAAATKNGIDHAKLVNWWTTERLDGAMPSDDIFKDGVNYAGNEPTKIKMAAWYARGKAFVIFTGCDGCKDAFGTSQNNPFDGAEDATDALNALQNVINDTVAHVSGCPTCGPKVESYFSSGQAKSDAEAYIAMLGQIDGMSDAIQGSDEFKKDGLYTSGFVKDVVNEYVNVIETYEKANVQTGDIMLSFTVDKDGNIKFTNNLSE